MAVCAVASNGNDMTQATNAFSGRLIFIVVISCLLSNSGVNLEIDTVSDILASSAGDGD